MTKLTAVATLVWLSVATATCRADLVLAYPGNSTVGYTAAASFSDPAIVPLSLVAGSGLTEQPAVNGASFNFGGWNGEANDYFSWGFTVAPGFSLQLSDFTIGLARSLSGSRSADIGASVNGGPSFSVYSAPVASSPATIPGIPLTSVPTLIPGDSIVFTLLGSGTSSTMRLVPAVGEDSIAVFGTVTPVIAAIPEPSAFLFGLIAALGAAVYRTRSGRS